MKTKLVCSLIYAMAGMLTWISVPAARAQANACGVANLPAPIQDLLKNKFPSLRPKQLSDMSANDQRRVLETKKKECPGIAVGHFENKDQLSYAILLVAKSEPTGG